MSYFGAVILQVTPVRSLQPMQVVSKALESARVLSKVGLAHNPLTVCVK